MSKSPSLINRNNNLSFLSKTDFIIESITDLIRKGDAPAGSALLSINVAALQFGVARKTVVRAYEKLKKQGYIESRPRKGYYVINKEPNLKKRILLVLHSFDAHFELLYAEFRSKIDVASNVDIYFHHYNIKVLELIIARNIDNYDLFVISSFNHNRIGNVIGRIPARKVLIVLRNDKLEKRYNEIVQNFSQGTISALTYAGEKLKKYKKLILCFPLKSGHPETLKNGFEKFCADNSFKYDVVDSFKNIEIRKGDAYLVVDDSDLIKILKVCRIRNWTLGKDLGVISYNETPLKEVIRDGITVISCDFNNLAEEMAKFVQSGGDVQKTIPISLISRNSL